MKLGIMQPYFFPYLGYFDLINCVDKWIVFDIAQYIRHGWINRNRILHPNEGWLYVVMPLEKHSRETAIKDVGIAIDQRWEERIIGQLQHYRKKSPYFTETMGLVESCLSLEEDSLSRMNVFILDRVCAHLNIRFDYSFFSEMNLKLGPVEGPGDWALRISEAMGAKEYVNPPGANFFDEGKFRDAGIRLTIRKLPPFEYLCRGYEFIANLSIIDVLLWNEPEKVKEYLEKHR